MNKITDNIILAATLALGISGNAKAQEPPQTSCDPAYDGVATMINFTKNNGQELTDYLKDMQTQIDSGAIIPCATQEQMQQMSAPPSTPDISAQKPFNGDLQKLRNQDPKEINALKKYMQQQIKQKGR